MGLLQRLGLRTATAAISTAVAAPIRRSLAAPAKRGSSMEQTLELLGKLQQQMQARSRQDIGTWRAAMQQAENVERPNRTRLYQVYRDVLLDDQVETCIENLMADILGQDFFLGDEAGEKDEAATDFLLRPWFYDFLRYAIESRIWGHSVVEFGQPVKTEGGGREFTQVELIPRDHVIPEWGLVVIQPGDDKGISYRDPAFAKTVIEVGKGKDLGLLLKAARPALYKKNVEGAWSQYTEIFGMPIRIGKVASRQAAEMDKMEAFLKNMGSAAYAVTGIDDEIELKETSKGDAYQVFERFLARADGSISKLFLGQTMTTDNGSSRSQSEVHERVGKSRKQAVNVFLAFLVNMKLLPLMAANGYAIKGKKFQWAAGVDVSELDITMDEFLVRSFEFDDLEHFSRKYQVPIKGLRAIAGAVDAAPDTLPSGEGKGGAKKPAGKPKPGSPKSLARIVAVNDELDKMYNDACCD